MPLIAILNTEFEMIKKKTLEYTYLNGGSNDYIYSTDYTKNEMKI